jgi:hypothetical protein
MSSPIIDRLIVIPDLVYVNLYVISLDPIYLQQCTRQEER